MAAILETVRPSIHSLNVTCLPGVFLYGLFRRKGEHKAPSGQKGQGMEIKPHEDVAVLAFRLKRWSHEAEEISDLWSQDPSGDSQNLYDLIVRIEETVADIRANYF